MSLYVDIEKTMGDFRLRVAFETEDEVFAILGASGCGKSLTLKCIAGIERPDRGVIRLDGKTLFDSGERINVPARDRKIGYLFQDYALFPNMTVLENVMCGARDRDTAREFVRKFYLDDKARLYPRQLSGGQKQRVALARMLAAKPRYLLLDEPFSALDNYLKAKLERELMEIMDDHGKRAILVSHDRNEVYRLTERIAVMENGGVVDVRPKRELFAAPRTLAATLLTGCKNVTGLECRAEGTYAADWGIYLRAGADEGAVKYRYAAVRAHYFEVAEDADGAGNHNLIVCDILREVEDAFSMVVLFRNRYGERAGDDSVLTAEFAKDEWAEVKRRTVLSGRPLCLRVPEDKIIWLER